jgi:hypothetical protein
MALAKNKEWHGDEDSTKSDRYIVKFFKIYSI